MNERLSNEEVMDKFFPKGDKRRGEVLVLNALHEIELLKWKQKCEELPKVKVICAAIKTGGNVVIRGQRHCDCIAAAVRMRTPEKFTANRVEGFMTSENKFVDRSEAMAIAIKSGQADKDDNDMELYSEDLY